MPCRVDHQPSLYQFAQFLSFHSYHIIQNEHCWKISKWIRFFTLTVAFNSQPRVSEFETSNFLLSIKYFCIAIARKNNNSSEKDVCQRQKSRCIKKNVHSYVITLLVVWLQLAIESWLAWLMNHWNIIEWFLLFTVTKIRILTTNQCSSDWVRFFRYINQTFQVNVKWKAICISIIMKTNWSCVRVC